VPSPIGHALAGTAVAWAGDASARRKSSTRFVVVCALLAALPDVDLLIPRSHRSVTHSLVSVILVFIIAAVVTGWVTRLRSPEQEGELRRGRLRLRTQGPGPSVAAARYHVAIVCAAAWASHLLLDWLGADTLPPLGIQVFWPFDMRFFVSGLSLFAETERRHPFSGPTLYQNLWAAVQEIAIMAPVAAVAWTARWLRLRNARAPEERVESAVERF
jgi:LexA-binding, inner membrane-associated putative hydrolase